MRAIVIKIGGSLSRGEMLEALCQQLAALGRHYPLLVLPGGGDFADTVRDCDRRYRLSKDVAHWMAILGMDQYGYLLCDCTPESVPVYNLADARRMWQDGRVPILLPFRLLHCADPLPHSWSVTSDSIAAWVATRVGARRLILLKDVDGLYTTDPRRETGATFLKAVSVDTLQGYRGVDRYLPALLQQQHLEVWMINGTKLDRLSQLLATGRTQGTRIVQSDA